MATKKDLAMAKAKKQEELNRLHEHYIRLKTHYGELFHDDVFILREELGQWHSFGFDAYKCKDLGYQLQTSEFTYVMFIDADKENLSELFRKHNLRCLFIQQQ